MCFQIPRGVSEPSILLICMPVISSGRMATSAAYSITIFTHVSVLYFTVQIIPFSCSLWGNKAISFQTQTTRTQYRVEELCIVISESGQERKALIC